jgi:hypothetical protein
MSHRVSGPTISSTDRTAHKQEVLWLWNRLQFVSDTRKQCSSHLGLDALLITSEDVLSS